MRPDLIAVGDVMVDVSVTAAQLATGGDVHGEVVVRPGGSATNAAVWAAGSGARVRLHGAVGDDVAGRVLVEAVAERGVEAALSVAPGARTGAVLSVRQAGERSMVADRGANVRLVPGHLPERLEAAAVLVSGYLLFHPGSEPAARAALERAVADHVAVDAASWPLVRDYGRDRFLASTAPATMLLANELEAHVLAPGTPGEAARDLSASYRHAVVKLDAGGAILGVEGRTVPIEGRRTEPLDPTGAGDALAGVALAALAGGAAIEEALGRGAEAAARVIESPSSWPEER